MKSTLSILTVSVLISGAVIFAGCDGHSRIVSMDDDHIIADDAGISASNVSSGVRAMFVYQDPVLEPGASYYSVTDIAKTFHSPVRLEVDVSDYCSGPNCADAWSVMVERRRRNPMTNTYGSWETVYIGDFNNNGFDPLSDYAEFESRDKDYFRLTITEMVLVGSGGNPGSSAPNSISVLLTNYN